jgi:hypothetical protein
MNIDPRGFLPGLKKINDNPGTRFHSINQSDIKNNLKSNCPIVKTLLKID